VKTEPMGSAVLHVVQRETQWTQRFAKTPSDDAQFLLGSITKPICIAALMTLFDKQAFALDDRVNKFLPQFRGDGREDVTIRHLLTHVSGLPDQLPHDADLRGKHADLGDFVEQALRVPLSFAPGSRYQYSSMAILLASYIAELLSGIEIRAFVSRAVLQPLGMKHSALGLGPWALTDVMPCQTEFAL
jgi:CubicO group peptidase (beta-lactamase class C family)